MRLAPLRITIPLVLYTALSGIALLSMEASAESVQSNSSEGRSLVSYKGNSALVGSILVEALTQGAFQVRVTSDAGALATIFTVDNPARLVIDLPFRGSRAHALKKPARIESAPNPLVAAVRIAAHESKIRIVLDLQGEIAPHYSVESRSKNLTIRLGAGVASTHPDKSPPLEVPAIQTKVPATSAPAVTALPTTLPAPALLPDRVKVPSEVSAIVTPSTVLSKTPVPPTIHEEMSATPSAPTTPIVPAEKPPASSAKAAVATHAENIEVIDGPALIGILFPPPPPNAEPAVKLSLNHRPRFRLARRDEQSYRLRIDDCTLGTPRVGLPFFPPQDFVGFTMIQATQVGNAVEVVIGADRGTRVTATPDDSDILLRASR